MERGAIAAFSVGGALAIGGVVYLFAAPKNDTSAGVQLLPTANGFLVLGSFYNEQLSVTYREHFQLDDVPSVGSASHADTLLSHVDTSWQRLHQAGVVVWAGVA